MNIANMNNCRIPIPIIRIPIVPIVEIGSCSVLV